MMTIVIKKSKYASCVSRLLMALMTGSIGASFIYLAMFILVKDAPIWFRAAFFIGGVCIFIAALFILKSAIQYLLTSSDWRVEISKDTLKWNSAAEHLQESFQVELKDIDRVQTIVEINRSEGGTRPREASNTIYLNSGDTISLREDISGILPRRVFKALEKRGIPYLRDNVRSVSAYRAMKTEDMPAGARESLRRNNKRNDR